MAVFWPDDSLVRNCEFIRTNRLQGGSLCLFNTNRTPLHGDLLANLTAVEATFGGYARIVCGSWGASFVNALLQAETDEVVRTFTVTGAPIPETEYGVFYIGADGLLAFVELNPTGGITLSAIGHSFSYQPKFVHPRA